MFNNYRKIGTFTWSWRLFFSFILLLAVGVFLYFKIVPTGKISYSRAWPRGLSSGQGFIYEFRPGERLDNTEPERLVMIGDPLYFSLFTPRTFDRAELKITYRDNLSEATPIVEIGVLKDKQTGSYELKPMDNKIINERLASWTALLGVDEERKTDDDNFLILQSEAQYDSRVSFLDDLQRGGLRGCVGGLSSCLAFYHYVPPFDIGVINHVSLQLGVEPLIGDMVLRGPHQFYVYFPAGDWNLNFEFAPLQESTIATLAKVRVWEQGRVVAEGQTMENNQEISLSGNITESGLFKVDINIDEQSLITTWRSSSDRLVFINRLWAVSGAANRPLFTDAAYLQLKAYETESLGGLMFAGQEFLVDESYRQFNFLASQDEIEADLVNREIILSKDNLVLESRGVFALSDSSLFNPDFKAVDRFSATDKNIKYIIAKYRAPLSVSDSFSDLKITQTEFNLQNAWRDQGRYNFLISVPGLGADTPGSSLEIVEIQVDLFGRTLADKLKELVAKSFALIINKFKI